MSIWFIDQPQRKPDGGWHVALFNGEDEEDYYDKVVRLTLEPMDEELVHDQVLLEIDRAVGWRASRP